VWPPRSEAVAPGGAPTLKEAAMAVFEYTGAEGGAYFFLPTAHGVAPFTELNPGDLVDFGQSQPPGDGAWKPAKRGAKANKRPDNHGQHPLLGHRAPDPLPDGSGLLGPTRDLLPEDVPAAALPADPVKPIA
jgi:hypothetical protein